MDKTIASKLRALKPGDIVEINGERLKVMSAWESHDSEKLTKPREIRSEGMEFELHGEDSSGYILFLFDVEIEYERVAELPGPAPLNSNPDFVFVQDTKKGKTYKYAITKRQKETISLTLRRGEDSIGIDSFRIF